ncbi:hypothetical protein [Caballeronia telluris]|uniref:Uncharacterized protein n=1 Tax=Caballeronia telluris TaxID=326475 RepID=A0A158ESU6_9BURK|nr:hypothetical protein [Caballeronia telluris]SAL10644.1 hypothetical protein AWB66_00216 [Caballeronia telluris]
MKIDTITYAKDALSYQPGASAADAFDSVLRRLERDMWRGAASGCRPNNTHAPRVAQTLPPSSGDGLAWPVRQVRASALQQAPSIPMSEHGMDHEEVSPQVEPIQPCGPEQQKPSALKSLPAWAPQAPVSPPEPCMRPPSSALKGPATRPGASLSPFRIEASDLRITLLQGASGASLAIRIASATTDEAVALARHALETFRRQGGPKPVRLLVNGVEHAHARLEHHTVTLDGEHHGD